MHVWGCHGVNATDFRLKHGNVRFTNCYCDGNDLLLQAPIYGVTIEDSYFIGGKLVLATTDNDEGQSITGLTFKNSIFRSGNGSVDTIELVETNGKFTQVENIWIDSQMVSAPYNGYNKKYTKVSKSLSLKNSTKWIIDFNDVLLFDTSIIPIQWMDYSFQVDSIPDNNVFIQHMAMKPANGKVIIMANIVCDATVYVTVDQSKYYI